MSGPRAPFSGPVRHVYVHVPFCRARCDYCEFASEAVDAEAGGRAGAEVARRLEEYVDGVAAEWERERAAHDVRRLRTLYLGGGTPSLLGPDRLERLLELFRPHLTPHAEVTVETNPEDVDDAYAAWAATAPPSRAPGAPGGVRVSLGAQSFSPELRAVLGRTAQADPAEAFRRLRGAGVENAGLDLIHGIPGQTPELLGADIAAVLELRPDHVSWYELDVVEGTALAARLAALGALDPGAMPADPMDDVRAAGYRRIVRELSRSGYDWYEVSNFALPGRRARHNTAYWRARPYLGLGPGAVSTIGARRWRNAAGTEAWAAALAAGSGPPRTGEALDPDTVARECLMLAARCGERVPLAEVAAVLDGDAAAALERAGLVSLHSGTIRVTRKGRHVADEVIVRLFRSPRSRGRLPLTSRQEEVLRTVIEEYIALGAPVGSRRLHERYQFGVAASTIRNDLADLEDMGMLAHPHTSAGRVPTDAGYRHYVDAVVTERRDGTPAILLERDRAASEIDDALRETAEALSRVTELLAVVSAPAVSTSTLRHIEILALQPRLVMVVLITTSGQVTKRMFSFADPVDEGLAEFARVYLNERLVGAQLGTRRVAATFDSADLRPKERAFLDALRPAFETPGPGDVEGLHLGGASRLLDNLSRSGAGHLNEVLEMLEERYNLLELLAGALRQDGVYLRIGHEMPSPPLQECSLVSTTYGVANRSLGTVSVIGPTRMDYQRVISTVRATADGLSAYLEDIW